MTLDLKHFKEKLETEFKTVEAELGTVARRNPENPSDWQALPPSNEGSHSDVNEQADVIEDFEENTAIVKQLEIQYNNIKAALERIENGTFGKCEINGEPIEPDRLEANPSARTCKTHKDVTLN